MALPPYESSLRKYHNAQNRRSGELSSRFYETYKNSVELHGCHIHCAAVDMSMATMCHCPSQHHGLQNCKCELICCKKCPILIIPSLETNKDATNMCSTIHFHVYRNVSRCTMHGQRYQEERTIFSLCSDDSSSVNCGKVYTRK